VNQESPRSSEPGSVKGLFIDYFGEIAMSLTGAIAYFGIFGGMVGLATVLMFGLRAVKLI
jgi:Cytochrome B6-F complex subunit VI (PetL)